MTAKTFLSLLGDFSKPVSVDAVDGVNELSLSEVRN